MVGYACFLATGYSLNSATMAIANKWALTKFPHSGTLTCLQFGFSAGMVLLLKLCRVLDADALQLTKVKQFAPAVIMFYISIACNMRLLARATVDTFIVIRSVAPILTQVGEVFLLGADWPNRDAWLALLVISMGALGFAHNNLSQMSDPVVLFWASTYLLCITADMLIVKRVITAIKLKPWGYVYYNNLLALCVYPFWALVTGEEIGRTEGLEDTSVMVAVATSCVLGLGISFFGLNTRLALSATAFTVLGAACKFLSIFLNMAVWHHHAPHPAPPDPDVAIAHNNLALVRLKQRRLDEAEAGFRAALDLQKNEGEVYLGAPLELGNLTHNLATCHQMQGRKQLAEEGFQIAALCFEAARAQAREEDERIARFRG